MKKGDKRKYILYYADSVANQFGARLDLRNQYIVAVEYLMLAEEGLRRGALKEEDYIDIYLKYIDEDFFERRKDIKEGNFPALARGIKKAERHNYTVLIPTVDGVEHKEYIINKLLERGINFIIADESL